MSPSAPAKNSPPPFWAVPAELAAAARGFAALALATLALATLVLAPPAWAGEARVAVASNFQGVMVPLAAAFTRQSGHTLVVAPGSTGRLYAQIRQGAPFDLLLAADTASPQKLEREGLAVKGSRQVYALGRLVLVGLPAEPPNSLGDCLARLKSGGYRRLALANPRLAPYGQAAQETLERLKLSAAPGQWIQTENITQALQLVQTGNAELAFVAASQTRLLPPGVYGCQWPVPGKLHRPLAQEAIALNRSQGNPAARAFLAFLRGREARRIITQNGYGLP